MEKSTTMGDKYGKKGLMQQKVQPNSKYSGVKSTLNTGKKATDVAEKSDHQVAKLRNENFYRISAKAMVALLQANMQVDASGQEESKESIFNLASMEQQQVAQVNVN